MFTERIDFSHEATLTIDELIKRAEVILPDTDLTILKQCYEFAEKKHSGIKRSSGEPYIIHPLNVAGTLIKLKMDLDSIMAVFFMMLWKIAMSLLKRLVSCLVRVAPRLSSVAPKSQKSNLKQKKNLRQKTSARW